MSGSGRQQWQVQAEHSGSLIRLQNLIQRGSGSCLLILQQNRPSYRDGLIVFLGQENSRVLNLKELGNFDAFETELENQGQARILHLINLESLGQEKQQAFFKGLNYHREHIARTCPGILAFWLPEPLVREIALQAADFWAWREQVLDFSLPLVSIKRFSYDDLLYNVNANASAKQNRIEEIETFLARSAQQPSLNSTDLKRELGNLYKSISEYNKAKQMLTEAIAEYMEMDEVAACASTRNNLADLMVVQGEYEQALKIIREQVLPVYESLGDIQAKAVTMCRIADILQARGELDEALKIRQEEELPVYEKIDDVRAKAATMGRIADILQARGELDEAFKIYQEKVLPVYENLGDIQAKAVTMGKIADIFWARGKLDEALGIYHKKMLPVFEQLGDIRTKAVVFGRIADIFWTRGQLDEALKIFKDKVLPVCEKIGDIRGILFCRTKITLLLHEMDASANKEEIEELLRLALADTQRLKLPRETETIESIMKKFHIKAQ
ncbi:MAG: tetratricopeptide repeat protein [Candidatus Electrothrix sp. AU1_5]|nr:tetratricopeptide repeat protein [Candidatus Electrothrix gigas]